MSQCLWARSPGVAQRAALLSVYQGCSVGVSQGLRHLLGLGCTFKLTLMSWSQDSVPPVLLAKGCSQFPARQTFPKWQLVSSKTARGKDCNKMSQHLFQSLFVRRKSQVPPAPWEGSLQSRGTSLWPTGAVVTASVGLHLGHTLWVPYGRAYCSHLSSWPTSPSVQYLRAFVTTIVTLH